MNKNRKLINALLVSTMMLSGLGLDVSAADGNNVTRLGGNTRVETALEVSGVAYDKADTIVVAGYNGEVDALTGTLLASSMDAPLLLVSDKDADIASVKAEATKLGAKNVYLLGSKNVVSEKVETAMKDAGLNVKRMAGDDRFDTAVSVAKEVDSKTGHTFLTYDGRNGVLADALAAGPASGMKNSPILLTSTDKLPAQTKTALKDLNIKDVTIVGGKTVVDDAIVEELKAMDIAVNRVSGDNRWETAEKVANTYFENSDKAIIANDGYTGSYADALVGGYFGAQNEMPVLLTQVGKLPVATTNYLGGKAMHAYVLGSKAVVTDAAFNEIKTIVDKNNVVEDFKVASVEAISATQMLVEFTQEVDETTAEEATNYTLKSLDSEVNPKATKVDLQEDKKSVVVTVDSALAKRYQVKVQNVQLATDKKDVVDYDEVLTFVADTTAPTATAERVSINTFKINFSEPVKSGAGAIKAQYKDGTAVSDIEFSVTELNGDTEVEVVLGTEVIVDKEIIVTLNGVQDMVGNLITPQPTHITVTKKAADKVLPAIETVSQTGAKTFSIKFNKDLNGKLAASDITIGEATATKVKKISASEYEFTMNSNLKGLVTVMVAEKAAVDTDGQKNEKALEKIVTFKEDESKPKATTKLVVGKDNKEYLELTFDKDVTEGSVNLKGSHVKDYVTTNVNTTVNAVYADEKQEDKTVLLVPLADTLSKEEAVYDLTITSTTIKSDADVAMDSAKANFTRGKDGKPDVVIDAVLTKDDIKVSQTDNNNKVFVTFTLGEDQKLDGASATNSANYSIAGAEIESVSLAAAENNEQVVTLTLKDESNTFTGVRNIVVKDIKILGSSKVMSPVTINNVSLTENVKPELVKAQITKAGVAPEVTLTFTEKVTATPGTDNFTVLVGGKELTGKDELTANISVGGVDNTLVLTMNRLLTADELEKGIELKINKAEKVNITDLAGNAMSTTGTVKVVLK